MADRVPAADKLNAYMARVKDDLLQALTSEVVRQQMTVGLDRLAEKYPLREHLALRMYCAYALHGLPGHRGTIEQNWVWSKEQSRKYQQTAEFAEARHEIERINTNFQVLNTSFNRAQAYYVRANTDPRPWEEQLGNWLKSAGTAHAGGAWVLDQASQNLNNVLLQEIVQPASRESNEPRYSDAPGDHASLQHFKRFLGSSRTRPSPSLTWATPGLSQHGQAKAFDFVVHDGAGKEVVGTHSSQKQKWKHERWSEQLSTAVKMSSGRFSGPLQSPDEPWHYIYTPNSSPVQ
jgi:hypothetical protein